MLITNNQILIKAAEKNYDKFKVPTCFVEAKKIKMYYTSADQCSLDVNTSVNKIGEIVNLSQYLQSIMWECIYKDIKNGIDEDTAFKNQAPIYKDICILSAASGVEIDKAKRVFEVDITKMLKVLKSKYAIYTTVKGEEKFTKPMFFKNITLGNGYTLSPNHHYRYFETPMDYVQKVIRKFKADDIPATNLSLCDIIAPQDINWNKVGGENRKKVHTIIEEIKRIRNCIKRLYVDYDTKTKEEKSSIVLEANNLRRMCIDEIAGKKYSEAEMYMLLREIDKDENAGYARSIFDILFATGNATLYEMIRDSSGDIYKVTQKPSNIELNLFDFKYFKQKIG